MTKTRKIVTAVSIAILILLAVALIFTLSGCNSSWDVSADSDSSLTAKLVKNGDEYTLSIGGSGYMKSWDDVGEVPWKDKSNKITEVDIGNGVLSVGSNAFYSTAIKSVVLPESVGRVGQSAFKGGVNIYAYSEDIDYAEEYRQVHLYSEEVPASDDRFWQQDKSNGKDIFGETQELFKNEGKFWHFTNAGQAAAWEKVRILFIGNSFTYRNGVMEPSSGVPGIFDNIAEDLGYWVETYSVTGPGWYLKNHAKATDACGKQIDKLLNARSDFDYIVLQEHSLNPFKAYDDFLGGVQALQTKIQDTQDHAQIVLYETWGSPSSAASEKTTVPEMESWLREAYENAAEECGGLTVSYVGKAFTEIFNNEPDIYLWDTDNRHQGYTGAYLSACVHVGTILGGDVRNTSFKGEEKYSAPELSDEVLTALRNTAYNVVFAD